MNNLYTNNYSTINLYKKTSLKSEIVTQIVYGESFTIINKSSSWAKIKVKEDCYIGFIKAKKYSSYL